MQAFPIALLHESWSESEKNNNKAKQNNGRGRGREQEETPARKPHYSLDISLFGSFVNWQFFNVVARQQNSLPVL